jgi:hypothetical protein
LADVGKFGISKQAVGYEAAPRRAVAARKVVENDTTIIFADVRELRTSGTFAGRPDFWHARLQALIDANVAVRVDVNIGAA